MSEPPDLAALNEATRDAFAASLAPFFEGASRFLARLAAERPFDDWEALFEIGRAIARVMPEDEQVELIDAHPRLGADPATVSAHSYHEQGYDRPSSETPVAAPASSAAAELARLNESYEARFGFRYCVFVAGRSRAALLPGLRIALKADRSAELQRALGAVVDIAESRHEASRRGVK